MGATTIWERWNSVLEDGSISDTGMNSLNHYAYGSVTRWIFEYAGGIRQDEDSAGFKKALFAPVPDW
jgi:alpha-L-rhamnosidase